MDLNQFLALLLKTQLHLVLWNLLKWGTLGVLAGAPLGWLAWRLLRGRGAWRLEHRHARWWQWAAAAWLVLAGGGLGCLLGLLHGATIGAEIAVRQSQFRTEVLDPVGKATAHGLVALDFLIADLGASTGRNELLTPEHTRALEAFDGGGYEFNATSFLARAGTAERTLVGAAVARTKERLAARFRFAPGGLVETLVGWTLDLVARQLVREKLEEQLDKFGLGAPVREFFASLPAAARAGGDPDTLTAAELSAHVVERVAVPVVLLPIRSVIGGKTLLVGLLVVPALLLPVAAFAFGRRRERDAQAAGGGGGSPGGAGAPTGGGRPGGAA